MVESAGPSGAERRALADGDETGLSIAIARRYYFHEESKVTIARALGLSRFQVARLLQEARRDGLVRIEIGRPGSVDEELSDAVREALQIDRAVVVETSGAPGSAAVEFLGKALAEELVAASSEHSVVGLTWSRAAAALSGRIQRLRAGAVLQLAGAIYPPDGLPGSVEVVRAVAEVAGAAAYPIYAPLLVPNAETAAGLRRQPEIAAALDRFPRLDVAVVSVGAWRAGSSAVHDLLTPAEARGPADAGACGEISARLFDAAGEPVATEVGERVVGIAAEQLRAVPRIITSSFGPDREHATRAAAAAGFVHTLVLDDELARRLVR